MKIVVPVEGGSLKIVTRTGRAPFFAIFEFVGDDFKLLELRENAHAKEHEEEEHGRGRGLGHGHGDHEEHSPEEVEHHHQHLKLAKLDECKYLVHRALGKNMKDAVKKIGMIPVKVSKKDGDDALEVLKKYKDKFN